MSVKTLAVGQAHEDFINQGETRSFRFQVLKDNHIEITKRISSSNQTAIEVNNLIIIFNIINNYIYIFNFIIKIILNN